MSNGTCVVPDCNALISVQTRELCAKHYQRFRVHGSTDLPARPAPHTGRVELGLLTCRICGEPMQKAKSSGPQGKAAHRSCRASNPAARQQLACAHCGSLFTSVKRSDGRWTQACSKACARRLQISEGEHPFAKGWIAPEEREERAFIRGELSRRKRRARLAGVKREPYTRAYVAERDGYLCSLCGERVDMSLKYPHPGSPSVDHIIPLSRGGDDTLANVALACLGCNLSKGVGDGSKEVAISA